MVSALLICWNDELDNLAYARVPSGMIVDSRTSSESPFVTSPSVRAPQLLAHQMPVPEEEVLELHAGPLAAPPFAGYEHALPAFATPDSAPPELHAERRQQNVVLAMDVDSTTRYFNI